MDDNHLLNKGGNESHIEEYANTNGANLTKLDILEEATRFCEDKDENDGEAWSNTYDELPLAMEEFAKSKVVKEYHTQNMWSNEEVLELLFKLQNNFYPYRLLQITPLQIEEWFNYKKK